MYLVRKKHSELNKEDRETVAIWRRRACLLYGAFFAIWMVILTTDSLPSDPTGISEAQVVSKLR